MLQAEHMVGEVYMYHDVVIRAPHTTGLFYTIEPETDLTTLMYSVHPCKVGGGGELLHSCIQYRERLTILYSPSLGHCHSKVSENALQVT